MAFEGTAALTVDSQEGNPAPKSFLGTRSTLVYYGTLNYIIVAVHGSV